MEVLYQLSYPGGAVVDFSDSTDALILVEPRGLS
jgi:hypothetical protein